LNRRVHARRTRAAEPSEAIHANLTAATGLAARKGGAAIWLQQAAGNHAAAGVLARAPEAPVKAPPKNAPGPGEAQAKKLAALLPGKRDEVVAELGGATDAVRQEVDDAAVKLLSAARNAKDREAIALLRRCIAFARHGPKTPSRKPGPGVSKGGDETVTLEAKVAGGEIKVRTGVEAGLGRPTFSLTYSGDHADDCHWLQFIWREIVPQHAAASGGGMVDEPPIAGRVERAAGFSYNLSTDKDAPEWNTDTADKSTAFYEEDTGAVKRGERELAMFDDPDPRDNILQDVLKARKAPPLAHAVSRAHFDTYLVRGMDVLFRVRLDLSWQIVNGKADAAPQIDVHGEAMKGIRPAQLAKLKEQLGGKAEVPDYLATAEEKAAKPAAAKPAARRAVQRDGGAFAPVKDLSKGTLPASEWDPKTRTRGLEGTALLADIATLATADRIEVVTGTAKSDINALAKKEPDKIKPGLNYVASIPGADGETGFIDAGAYVGPAMPVSRNGDMPTVAIMVAGTAFDKDKSHALATIRHEMRHAEHCLLAVHALKSWRELEKGPAFDDWLKSHVKEPNLTLIRERVQGTLPNTELLAYTEGLVASFQFIPQVPDPKLMVPGKYPSAIFELIKAGQQDNNTSPHVSKAADERLRDYCRNVLTAPQRSALVAWVDFLMAYVTAKAVPAEHKDADPSWATAVKADVKTIAPFLKRVREIALKADSKK
jgi:hypothetical protein